MRKPIIGISGSILTDASGNFAGYKRAYVNHDYISSVLKNGGIPVILPFSEDMEAVRRQIGAVDGLLLSGGQDVYPQHYGEEPRQKLGETFPERDIFDFELIRCCMEEKKPILGICRGMQIINTYFKGTLYQDLSYVEKETLRHNQQTLPAQLSHCVEIEEDSKLYGIFGERQMPVNSFHHQAVRQTGEGLRVTARAKDGIVEAIEHKDYPFLLAVQWHPEMLHQSCEPMNKLFAALIAAAEK